MIDFKPSKTKYNSTVSVSVAREVLHILQNHYPERLGKALIINVPWIVWGFFKLINPFIDPVTRDKVKFNGDMTQYVAPDQLWRSDWGGRLEFDYEHDAYWPALDKLCQERREARTARWEAGGKLVGESELYLAGGSDESVSGRRYGSEETSNGHAAAGVDEKGAVAGGGGSVAADAEAGGASVAAGGSEAAGGSVAAGDSAAAADKAEVANGKA
ncbi:hypothetical protein CDD82_3107 [Ophiocordyceps australis]|uniref:CRAL-TRIO domain-containing protein n=1 Tax=Ophiocordyceps australis TaxID=1399860 RepID=A0A2C5XUK6_9HYPO|nr:hypothetical protein CDD82_3107 [Ophiocordyceps australis]